MAKGISQFKAQTNADFARPNLFEVGITKDLIVGPQRERIFINCFQVNVPGLSIATTNKDQAYRSVAYQKIYEDITLGFYCSGDMKELRYLQNWMNTIIRPKDNHVEYYDNYTGTIDIISLGVQEKTSDQVRDRFQSKVFLGENERIMTTKILEAYPKSISSLAMDYGTKSSILNVTATFTYRTYIQTYGDSEQTGEPVNKFLAKNLLPGQELLDNGSINHNLSKTEREEGLGGGTSDESDIE
tara:strand:- start:51 stop:779 length:729 start_codon:yes stop_codon:yes gene_type:complete